MELMKDIEGMVSDFNIVAQSKGVSSQVTSGEKSYGRQYWRRASACREGEAQGRGAFRPSAFRPR
eukprot:10096889-Lingulodinium_polyedra.AAC.1